MTLLSPSGRRSKRWRPASRVLYAERDHADEVSLAKLQLVVNGVLADPDLGPDSALYQALGYTRQSDRKSGLTRKHEKTPEK